jgi:hypothetical protein
MGSAAACAGQKPRKSNSQYTYISLATHKTTLPKPAIAAQHREQIVHAREENCPALDASSFLTKLPWVATNMHMHMHTHMHN